MIARSCGSSKLGAEVAMLRGGNPLSDRAGADRGVCTDRSPPPRGIPDSKEGFEIGAWNAEPASGIEISR